MRSPSRRADSPREISEAERPGWMRGRTARNLPRFRMISLSSAVCVAARCRAGAEIQNLSESLRLAVFDHERSYILIDRGDSRAILYIPRDLFLFDYQRNI